MSSTEQITFAVRRFHPAVNAPHVQRFTVDLHKGMTVLEGLLQIRESQDASLAWRFSCRMGVCGSCAMLINASPRLACNTQIRDVAHAELRLAPLSNFPVIKDLVADFDALFEKHAALAPYITRDDTAELNALGSEFRQTPAELTQFLQFAGCIKCGACMAACPTMASDARFLGPMPLTAAYRYNADTRDDGFAARKQRMRPLHAVEHCHYAGECSRVCPKGVDPARALQLLRRDLLLDWLGLGRRKPLAVVQAATDEAPGAKPRVQAPPFTVRR